MKIQYILIVLLLIGACKPSKNASETNSEESNKSDAEMWTVYNYHPTKEMNLPTSYLSYQLNEDAFIAHLETGRVVLPLDDGSFSTFTVSESSTISDEMRKKFPNLNSYKGVDVNNDLCQCTIDKKNTDFSITIFCNNKTVYIKDLYKNEIYFVYNKKDVPAGVGTINE